MADQPTTNDTPEPRNLFWLHLKITISPHDDPDLLTQFGGEVADAIRRMRIKYPYPRLTFEDLMIVPDAQTQPIFFVRPDEEAP